MSGFYWLESCSDDRSRQWYTLVLVYSKLCAWEIYPSSSDNCNHQRRNLPGVHFMRRICLFPACAGRRQRAESRLFFLQSNAWLLTDILLTYLFRASISLGSTHHLSRKANHNEKARACLFEYNLSYETANWTEKKRRMQCVYPLNRMAMPFVGMWWCGMLLSANGDVK